MKKKIPLINLDKFTKEFESCTSPELLIRFNELKKFQDWCKENLIQCHSDVAVQHRVYNQLQKQVDEMIEELHQRYRN